MTRKSTLINKIICGLLTKRNRAGCMNRCFAKLELGFLRMELNRNMVRRSCTKGSQCELLSKKRLTWTAVHLYLVFSRAEIYFNPFTSVLDDMCEKVCCFNRGSTDRLR